MNDNPQPKKRYTPALTAALLLSLSLGTQAQTAIPAASALPVSAADASKPGFVVRVHQVASSQPTTLARTENQLAGLVGDNIADPAAQGSASGPGTPASPGTAPITFLVPGVINMEQSGGSTGNFTPDEQMPGIPGTTGSTDSIAIEVLTWLDLPAGEIVMGVNSDDGFRVTLGGANPTDKFAISVGAFDGGRGAADSIFRFTIAQAGLYAARLIFNEGGGGASLEWFTRKADGSNVLINDAANGGIKAYQAVAAGAGAAFLSRLSPGIDQTGIAPNGPIDLELTEGATAIDAATVRLSLDGAPVAAVIAKTGDKITIKYTPATIYAPSSSHAVALSYTEGSTPKTLNWSFRAAAYGTLAASAKVTPDTSKPGFVWSVFANAANQTSTNQRAEDALAGLLKDADGNPLPNLADPAARGAAIAAATAASPANAPLKFEVSSVINFTQDAASDADNQNGNFKPDLQMPGIPSSEGTDGISAEIVTYIELPAGVVTMGVNSDDGFRTTAGDPLDIFGAIVLGEFDGGRGAADTIFSFVVQEAGVYAFRTIWQEGGGGANIEWFTVNSDGSKALVNDVANGGLKAYRALQGGTNPYIKAISPGKLPRQVNQPSAALNIVLADGNNRVDENSVVLKIDGQEVPIAKNPQGSAVTVTHTPTTLRLPSQIYSAEISFKDSTGNFSRTQQWNLRNLINLVLPPAAVRENFDSYDEGTVPTGWVEKNFTTTRTDEDNLDDLNSNTYKGWVVVSRERMQGLKGRVFNVAPGQLLNGQEVTVDTLSEGNLLYAESDVRGGDQVQFITSKPFNLSSLTHVVLSFSSLYEQNQDSIGAVEYSVDGGNNWLPVVYYLDSVDGGGDIKFNPDGTVDAVATLTSPNADTAAWTDNGVAKGDKYGDALLAPITAALGDFIAPRINDNSTIDKRVEAYSLPSAGGKTDVRLRFAQLGTGSWYFAIDNLGFHEGPAPVTPPAGDIRFAAPTIQGGSVRISWTGAGTLQTAEAITGPWTNAPDQSNPQSVAPAGLAKFYRVRR